MVRQCHSFVLLNHAKKVSFIQLPPPSTAALYLDKIVKRRRQQTQHFLSLGEQKSSDNPNPNPNSKQKQKQKQQPKGKGYQQIGGPIAEDLCTLSKEEIIGYIKQRTKERRNQNFQRADEILVTLKQHFVFVNDATKQWRADGQSFVYFDGPSPGPGQQQPQQQRPNYENSDSAHDHDYVYNKARNSKYISDRDEEYIKNKLRERYVAKLNRDYNTADDIVDELRYIKNVEIDDSKKTFRAVDPFKLEYTFGGKRINNIHPDVLKEIEHKVKERTKAKNQKDYEKADALLEDLSIVHGVRVDDTKKEWHFMSKKKDDGNRDRQQVRNSFDSKRTVTTKSQQKNKAVRQGISSDWSIVDKSPEPAEPELIAGVSLVETNKKGPSEIPIPEGIVIDDHTSNDATAPENQKESFPVPDGIVINNHIVQDESSSGSVIDNNKEFMSKKSELESLTVPLLKERLRSKGLPVSGRKMELIERLING